MASASPDRRRAQVAQVSIEWRKKGPTAMTRRPPDHPTAKRSRCRAGGMARGTSNNSRTLSDYLGLPAAISLSLPASDSVLATFA